jgi:hypothetical protein
MMGGDGSSELWEFRVVTRPPVVTWTHHSAQLQLTIVIYNYNYNFTQHLQSFDEYNYWNYPRSSN